MAKERQIKKCRESRVIQTHRVFPNELNHHGTLFGGRIMSLIDDTASISVSRHARKPAVTASMDSLDFINPIGVDHSVCVESFISGAGKSSLEVFCKVIGENLASGERLLCATAFITFTCFNEDDSLALVPLVEPETPEEKYICKGYVSRREERLKNREWSTEMKKNVSLSIPWVG